MTKLIQRGSAYYFNDGDTAIRVDMTLFRNEDVVVTFINSHLPWAPPAIPREDPPKQSVNIDLPVRASKLVALLMSVCVMAFLAVFLPILFSASEGVVGFIIGSLGSVFALFLAKHTFELQSIKIDEQGVEQIIVFADCRFMARRRLEWSDINDVCREGFAYLMTGNGGDVCVNMAVFWHWEKVLAYVVARLPDDVRERSGLS